MSLLTGSERDAERLPDQIDIGLFLRLLRAGITVLQFIEQLCQLIHRPLLMMSAAQDACLQQDRQSPKSERCLRLSEALSPAILKVCHD
ncbi:hypothetical protein [Sphingomonas sp.]|uniref:hypothetical protein n=1 Tax=Sphingomonas sp. TaxID=28214 RepID=UPI003B3BCCFA